MKTLTIIKHEAGGFTVISEDRIIHGLTKDETLGTIASALYADHDQFGSFTFEEAYSAVYECRRQKAKEGELLNA